MERTIKTHYYWLAGICEVVRVKILAKGTGGRELFYDVPDPYLVEDDSGEEFVVDRSEFYHSPVAARRRARKLALEFDVECREPKERDE